MAKTAPHPWLQNLLHALMVVLLAAGAFLMGKLTSHSTLIEAEAELVKVKSDLEKTIDAQKYYEAQTEHREAMRAERARLRKLAEEAANKVSESDTSASDTSASDTSASEEREDETSVR